MNLVVLTTETRTVQPYINSLGVVWRSYQDPDNQDYVSVLVWNDNLSWFFRKYDTIPQVSGLIKNIKDPDTFQASKKKVSYMWPTSRSLNHQAKDLAEAISSYYLEKRYSTLINHQIGRKMGRLHGKRDLCLVDIIHSDIFHLKLGLHLSTLE